MKKMFGVNKILGAFLTAAALAVAIPAASASSVSAATPGNSAINAVGAQVSDTKADRAVTDISSRRYYRRYGYGYRPHYYRPRYYRPYGYYRPYRPYGYYGGYYRRPGIYLGF